jgi:heme exporter protein B
MEASSSTLAPPAAVSERARENWWDEVRAVLVKDFRSELRAKSAVTTILMFALTTMALISLLVVTTGVGFTTDLVADLKAAVLRGDRIWYTRHSEARATLLATLYWIVLYFSAMAGLSRVFVKEEEMRTAPMLRLAARPSAVFTGKLLFNVALLELVALLILPFFLLFFQPQVHSWPLLMSFLVLGPAAMACAATILGAMASRARNGGYMMVILGFAPLLPILVLAINGTAAAIYGSGGNNLLPLVSYLIVMTLVSGLLFERVWSD